MQCIEHAVRALNDVNYKIKKYHIFKIYEPKVRLIMSLNIVDKLVNHYFTENVLKIKLEKYLDIRNVATRKDLGTDYAIKLLRKYIEYYKNKEKVYYLKIDIKKYFYNIDHEVLKKMLIDKLTDDEYIRVCNIIDSTDESYINEEIIKLGDNKLPLYKKGKGLPIGNLSSQLLSIFYLNELDHFIIHNLKLKHYIRYMDDFVILNNDKEKLRIALKRITFMLKNKYYLDINANKTFIKDINSGLIFLGRRFLVKRNKTIMIIYSSSYRKIKKNIRKIYFKYKNGYIKFNKFFESMTTYLYSYKFSRKKLKNHLESRIIRK